MKFMLPTARRFFALPALLLSIGFAAPAAAQNLVPNGNFNIAASKPNRPSLWTQFLDSNGDPIPYITENYLPTGGQDGSACIEAGHAFDLMSRLLYGSQQFARYRLDSGSAITVNAGAYYKFSVKYRSVNVADGQILIEFDFLNGSTFLYSLPRYLPGAADWTTFTTYLRPTRQEDRGFTNPPQDSTKLRIKLGVVSSLGTARFDDVSLVEVAQTEYQNNIPVTVQSTTALPGRRVRPTYFSPAPAITARKDANGAWWLVKPDGKPVWYRAVQYASVQRRVNPTLWNSLPVQFQTAESSNGEYQLDSLKRLGSLAFNGGAITDNNTVAHPNGELFFANLTIDESTYPGMGVTFLLDKDGVSVQDHKPMPDPYNPSFPGILRNYIETSLNALGSGGPGHPDFAGYFTDNEQGVVYLDYYIWSAHTAPVFVDFVKSRHGNSIAAVNAAWSSAYATFNMASFNDITSAANKAKIIRHHLDDPLRADLEEFIIKMLTDYYRIVITQFRDYENDHLDTSGDGIADKRHLIVTNRYDLNGLPNRFGPEFFLAMEAVKRINTEFGPGMGFNIIAANNYPGDEKHEGIRTPANKLFMEQMSAYTDLPIMISEFGVGARDSGIPTGNPATGDIGWFFRNVDSQAKRGEAYQKAVLAWAESPSILGAQWFRWMNVLQTNDAPTTLVSDTDSRYLGRNSGVVDNANNFYTGLTTKMAETNQIVEAAFAPTGAPIPSHASVANALLGKTSLSSDMDVNHDGAIDIGDVVAIVSLGL